MSARILGRRLARASKLLADARNAAVSITEIAYATGFHEAAQFSRSFHAHFATTPSRYRRDKLAGLRARSGPGQR